MEQRPAAPRARAASSREARERAPAALAALMAALDLPPWPVGEDVLAGVFLASAIVHPGRLRRALAWARDTGAARPGRLALGLCAHRGRVIARRALLGLRNPEALRRHQVVRGREHLGRKHGGTVLVGFHLGMPNSDLALRLAGHALTWLGHSRPSRRWAAPPWQALLAEGDVWLASDDASWSVALARARRILLEGRTIYLTADGQGGRESFRVPLPGGPLVLRSGWLTLCERTEAAVLPVLSHREGRADIVTIHPPLPSPRTDISACRLVLERLLADYVRRFPEQCYSLAFKSSPPVTS